MKIMVVDDSKTIRLILNKTLFENIPLVTEIILCENGQEALDKLKEIEVDLVLLDVIMEGLDGYEVCKSIKSNPKTKELSVIFLTSKSKQEDILHGFEVGGVDYVSKPFNRAELIARVQTQLELVHLKNKEIEKSQSEIILKMGEIAELRSKETGNHVKRVASYCALLGKLYGLDSDRCHDLELASPMHDIGKVAIPDSILNKPSKLNEDEINRMKEHTTLGYKMFKNSTKPILKAASIVAHEHHEKYDGSGYPRGIAGKEIHIYGRIIAVADVFDALGSDRVYKKAWENEKIVDFFIEEKGKHFDPKLVDIFLENIDQFIEIQKIFNDSFQD